MFNVSSWTDMGHVGILANLEVQIRSLSPHYLVSAC